MSTTMPAGGAPGYTPPAFLGNILGTVDYVSRSAGRVLEGVYDYKLLKTELQSRNAQAQWQRANAAWLAAQAQGSAGSDWSTQGPQDQVVAGGLGEGVQLAGIGSMPKWAGPVFLGVAATAILLTATK